MKSRDEFSRIGVVIYEGVEPIDVGATVGVISMSTRVLPKIESVVIAASAGPVRLAGGLVVMADYSFANAPPCDTIIVTGGPGWREQTRDQRMLDFVHAQSGTGIASVCTGALILSAAGILNGLKATTRRRAVGTEKDSPLDLLKTFSATLVPQVAVVVDDHGVVTGGGVSLAIDATLYLLGRMYGTEARDQIASVIEYDRAFAANKQALGHTVEG